MSELTGQDITYDSCEPVPVYLPLPIRQMPKINEHEEYWRVWELKGWYSESEGWFWRDTENTYITVLPHKTRFIRENGRCFPGKGTFCGSVKGMLWHRHPRSDDREIEFIWDKPTCFEVVDRKTQEPLLRFYQMTEASRLKREMMANEKL